MNLHCAQPACSFPTGSLCCFLPLSCVHVGVSCHHVRLPDQKREVVVIIVAPARERVKVNDSERLISTVHALPAAKPFRQLLQEYELLLTLHQPRAEFLPFARFFPIRPAANHRPPTTGAPDGQAPTSVLRWR